MRTKTKAKAKSKTKSRSTPFGRTTGRKVAAKKKRKAA